MPVFLEKLGDVFNEIKMIWNSMIREYRHHVRNPKAKIISRMTPSQIDRERDRVKKDYNEFLSGKKKPDFRVSRYSNGSMKESYYTIGTIKPINHGPYEKKDEQGRVIQKLRYSRGVLNGEYYIKCDGYAETGIYKNGKKVEITQKWDSGRLKMKVCVNDKGTSRLEYNKNGQLITEKHLDASGRKHGRWFIFDSHAQGENPIHQEVFYKDGCLFGTYYLVTEKLIKKGSCNEKGFTGTEWTNFGFRPSSPEDLANMVVLNTKIFGWGINYKDGKREELTIKDSNTEVISEKPASSDEAAVSILDAYKNGLKNGIFCTEEEDIVVYWNGRAVLSSLYFTKEGTLRPGVCKNGELSSPFEMRRRIENEQELSQKRAVEQEALRENLRKLRCQKTPAGIPDTRESR